MHALNADEKWITLRGYNRASKHAGPKEGLKESGSHQRKTATFEYVHAWEDSVK
jgi:hypothetical protein